MTLLRIDALDDPPDRLLTTVGDLRTTLGAPADAGVQSLLTLAVSAASSAAADYCGRDFARRQWRATWDGGGYGGYLLPHFPIVSIDSVTSDGLDVPHRELGGAVYRDDLDAKGWGDVVVVTWTAGYTLPNWAGVSSVTLPSAVSQATIEVARHIYLGRSRAPTATQESLGGIVSAGFSPLIALPSLATTLLDPYRIVVV